MKPEDLKIGKLYRLKNKSPRYWLVQALWKKFSKQDVFLLVEKKSRGSYQPEFAFLDKDGDKFWLAANAVTLFLRKTSEI